MSEDQDEFAKAFEGFGEDPAEKPEEKSEEKEVPEEKPTETPEEKPADKETPEAAEKPEEKPKEEPEADPKEEKPEEKPAEEKPADDPEGTKKPEEKPGEEKESPKVPEDETPKSLTKDDVKEVISDLLSSERATGKEVEEAEKDVLEAYYPEGLSNVLVDKETGKELKTPQDVVDLTNGEMTTEQASQWLMNEQFKLDKQIDGIKENAREIAATTLKFKKDTEVVVDKYDPLFKWKPELQDKVWKQYKKLIKADEEKGVILSAPDMQEFYDLVLDPYRLAFEQSEGAPATNPEKPEEKPEPPKPTAEDRMDISGDGGPGEVNNPEDFAQQVGKELAKGL